MDDSPTEVLKLLLASMIWAELLGVPVAWLTLRRRGEWANRPQGMRRLDLLARYVGKVTAMVGLWSAIILVGALLGALAS